MTPFIKLLPGKFKLMIWISQLGLRANILNKLTIEKNFIFYLLNQTLNS